MLPLGMRAEGPGKMTIHSALSAHRARAKPGRRVISQCAELGLKGGGQSSAMIITLPAIRPQPGRNNRTIGQETGIRAQI